MAAGKYTFSVEQGATTQVNLQYLGADGQPVTLTDYSAKMQLRPAFADLTNVIYLTLSSSLEQDGTGIKFGSQSGSLSINISAEKTDSFAFDEAIYDLEITSGSYVARILEGKVKVKKSVTR